MKLSRVERTVATVAQKLAGFLVIKMHNAFVEGDTKLAEEIGTTLFAAGVILEVMPNGATRFQIKGAPFHGQVIPPHLQGLQQPTQEKPDDGQNGQAD